MVKLRYSSPNSML